MRRREFITLLGCAAAAWPLAARAQQADRVRRVGILGPGPDNPVSGPAYPVFISELRKLGFTEGQNLVVEHRRTDEGLTKAFTGANELVAAKAEVLVANGPEIALQAANAARPAVPIVMLANNYDPFARGYVKSLVQPGGNITGLYYRAPELAVKQLELLTEAFPERRRIAVLLDSASADELSAIERAAQSTRLSLLPLKLENPPYDFDAALRTVVQREAQTLQILSSPFFTPQRKRIADLAIAHRLPTMFRFRVYVEAGGLMSYGVDVVPLWRRAASYVAKILRGAQPAELPIEQTANFEFSINLKTAKAIGVELLTSILLRAEEVIE
jgi:putative tryptophan/tyrosine transport system substrate-binding protein